jgi:hypothetical protein
MKGGFDRNKSLEELEKADWGEPTHNSYLVTTLHRLRRKPLRDFEIEDFRIMIGQGIGLPFLVPLALERLEEEPLSAGDFYRGDLLRAVLQIHEEFWMNHPDSFEGVRNVVGRVKDLLPSLNEIDRMLVLEVLAAAPESLTA